MLVWRKNNAAGRNDRHHVMRNWRVEGSHNGIEWVPLRNHQEDVLLGSQQFST